MKSPPTPGLSRDAGPLQHILNPKNWQVAFRAFCLHQQSDLAAEYYLFVNQFKPFPPDHLKREGHQYERLPEEQQLHKRPSFVTLKSGNEGLYKALPVSDSPVAVRPTGAIWVPSTFNGSLRIHFPGGAYVTLSADSKNAQTGPRLLAKELGTPLLIVDYRKSCYPGCSFPAALQNDRTAYNHLLDLGVSSFQILLSGDSAGGNLVLALLRFINATHESDQSTESSPLPYPAGAALWSPWVDMSDLSSVDNENAASDCITGALLI
ncbi:MAG: hypothetical protein Q9162_001741 [Coniocarpon cinnabarinum]